MDNHVATPLLAPSIAALTKSWIAVVFRRNRGAVTPGANTPGIFAMRRLEDVDGNLLPAAVAMSDKVQIIVRGSVLSWGDTIEHEDGVKGELAYPRGSSRTCSALAAPRGYRFVNSTIRLDRRFI